MPIRAHLRELRKRLLLSLAGIAVGAVAGWYLFEPVMEWIQQPLKSLDGYNAQLNFQTIGAAFDLKMKVAIWVGTLITSPWWVYQLFAFISPGLKKKERLLLLIFGFTGVVLFAAGAASGMLMIPRAVEILTSFTPDDAENLLRADGYVSFYMRLVIAFGLSFLLPEVLVVLNFMGVLSSRAMLRGWRWAVVGAFIFAAIANPLPSPWPMTIQALALIALYLIAVGISALRERSQRKKLAAENAEMLEATSTASDVLEPSQERSAGNAWQQ